MTVFRIKNLVKAFLEEKYQGKKKGGKFMLKQNKLRHRNRYRNSILVSVADTETRFRSYTTVMIFIPALPKLSGCLSLNHDHHPG